MKKGLILVLACVLIAGVVGAETTETTYEVVEGVGRITETRVNVRDYSLEQLLREKARCLESIENNKAQKVNCDAQIAKINAKIAKIDTLIGQLVP